MGSLDNSFPEIIGFVDRILEKLSGSAEYLFVDLREPHAPLTKSGVETMIKKVGKAAGFPKLHPHVLRHSFASHMIEQGVSLENIQAMMGHRTPESTHKYIHVSNKALMGIKSPLDHPAPKKRGRKKKNV